MRVPYTFDVCARFKNKEYGSSWVPIDRLPAVEVPKIGERFVIDEGLSERIFGEEYKQIASLYPVDLGRVAEILHFIDLEDRQSKTTVWTEGIPSKTESQDRFNEFVREWNEEHLSEDPSLPHEMYRRHSQTYQYDLQVNVKRDDVRYTRIIRNVPFETKVISGHTFFIDDGEGGHPNMDSILHVSEAKQIIQKQREENPTIYVDFIGVKKDIARLRPSLLERQYKRLEKFVDVWNASCEKTKKDISVA